MAANCSTDPKAKKVFARLAEEELGHMDFLRKHYEAVVKTGKPSLSVKLGSSMDLSDLSPIFSEGIKARIGDAHFEMSALSIGIQLELDAIKFYRAQAEAADCPETKKLYGELVEWESGHYDALLRQHEDLKEDYWSANGFSPF
jgi:rubrerythrin